MHDATSMLLALLVNKAVFNIRRCSVLPETQSSGITTRRPASK